MCCSFQLAAVAFLTANGAVQAAGPFPGDAVGMVLVAVVVMMAAPAGQPLECGSGGLPVAATAGRLPTGFGAQQPVDLVLIRRHRRLRLAVAAAKRGLAAGSATALPTGPVGRLAG
jgi:hypothetical protein